MVLVRKPEEVRRIRQPAIAAKDLRKRKNRIVSANGKRFEEGKNKRISANDK